MTAHTVIEDLKQAHAILVFSKPSCPQCDVIKLELEKCNEPFLYLDVTTMDDDYNVDAIDVMEELKSMTGSKSFPFCFYEGNYIPIQELKKKLIKINFTYSIEDF
ncbi:hypothetical protein QKU58_gp103 [Pyramimonas orientalis virus]|uniref:Glutaredoxin domain-containing protein n=1 Tax=Pyramimonas orientalis virus 01B TaxID=3134525 RepID=A0A7M3UNH3_9VIRU|nr:hypothetical protein QKU58_gp103 [Pyramimonas orientalis virus]QOI90228.1 hypothetical protein HWQ62_00091 [Pyramimonas orientalis virus]